MSGKALPLLLILFLSPIIKAQISLIHTFGEPLKEEFALTNYSLDPEAAGIVLYERGNYTVEESDRYIKLIKEVHRKIKVFDAKNFKYADIEIPYYRQGELQENVTKFAAVTHTGSTKTYVLESAIFDVDENPYWALKKFTFPNVQDGSILEYTYRVETPYFGLLGGWSFMNKIPTVYSELHTEIPGNFTYNRTLYGNRKLDLEHAEIKESCFHLPGFKVPGDCESATYVMKNIPAFKEEEYMLAAENYMPALKYELVEIIDLEENREIFAKTWKNVDKRLRDHKNLGKQLKYARYFKENLPSNIFSNKEELARAKAIYYYIQQNMSWNKKIWTYTKNRVRDAYETKTGNSSEINLALANALEAGGLDAKIILISTRDHALPTKQYPVLTGFNNVIVFLEIGGEKYFLDTTDKHTPFGVLPLYDLSLEGRVLDFKKGSYWEPIKPISRNMHYVNMRLEADSKGLFSGHIKEVSTGYISVEKRKKNNGYSAEENLKSKQSHNENLNISNLILENAKDLEQPYKESYDISLHEQPVGNRLFLYPFLVQTYFSKNPFQKESRLYPIDFAFPVINNYLVSIDLKDQYELVKMPENKIIKLPENDGEVSVVYDVSGSKVNIRLSVRLNNTSFSPEAYKSLQEFFGALMGIQKQEPLELKKTEL